MAVNFEYWTAVFPVGLEGFSDSDHDELNAIAAEGWEPFQLAAVHSGFAAIVLFRRALTPAPPRRATGAKKVAKKAAGAKKAKKASAR